MIAAAAYRRKPHIEYITAHRGVGDDLEYRVKWRGRRKKVWEPVGNVVKKDYEESVSGADDAVKDYWDKHEGVEMEDVLLLD